MEIPPTIEFPTSSPLEQILTSEEQQTLTDNVRQKLIHSIDELKKGLHTVRTQFQHDKVAYGQHVYDLDTELRDKDTKLECLKIDLENERQARLELETKQEKGQDVYKKLLNEKECLESTNTTITSKLHQTEQTNIELTKLIDKRNSEISKLTTDFAKLTEQLESTTLAKIEAMQKIDELTSREIEIRYREKTLERESTYNQEQLNLLQKELEKKNLDLLTTQRESSGKYLHLQTDLSEKIEQLKMNEMKLADITELNERSEKQVESLMDKLKAQMELTGKMEENYRVELGSLKRVAELYRESSEDSTKKLEELEDAVSNLQDLLKESTEKYGELETRFADSSRSFQEEISRRDERVLKLEQELKTANEVLEGIQKHGMTDEMIESLSPAAAAASTMLKESKSITEIFSKYQEVQLELNKVRCDNGKLNGYIKEILEDIETRAPILQKQKQEYERAMQTVEILSTQMDVTSSENNKSKTEIVQLKKNLSVAERENTRLKGQISDLARQVKCLLRDGMREEQDTPPTTGREVIAAELTTFKDVDELQRQNLRLLTVVRELTEERERGEMQQQSEQIREIRTSFTLAQSELADLKQIRLRQDAQMKDLQTQRDTLNNMLKQRELRSTTDLNTEKLKQTEKDLTKLKEEYGMYKKEKQENDRMTNEQCEKLRDEIVRLRSDNGRLLGQVEYGNERGKVYGKNLEMYKKQIAVLEERGRGLNESLGKVEGQLEVVKSELLSTHSQLSRAEVSISTLTNERNMLRESRSRLQLEKEMLQRHEKLTTNLQTNLEQIKNSLELSNSAVKIRLENEIDSLKSENTILKRRVESEASRSKELMTVSDGNFESVKSKLMKEEERCRKLESDIATLQLQLQQQQQQVQQPPPTELDTEPTVSLSNNIELITKNSEIESLKNQLDLAKSNLDEYKNLSVVLEEQLTMNRDTHNNLVNELELKISETTTTNCQLSVELDLVNKLFENYKQESLNSIQESNTKCNKMEEQLHKVCVEFDVCKNNLDKLQQQLQQQQHDSLMEVQLKEDLRAEYEREVVLRGEDATALRQLRVEVEQVKEDNDRLGKAKEKLAMELGKTQATFEAEKLSLNELNGNLKQELTSLREVVGKLEQQLVIAMSSGTQAESDLSGDKSQEQWLLLIRYLRREKEIAVGKMEMALAQCQRVEGQLSITQGQLEEVKVELGRVSGESSVGLLTAVKQSELMRKVETLSALTDSNRALREETVAMGQKQRVLETRLEQIEGAELNPMRETLAGLVKTNEQLGLENDGFRQEAERWRERATALIEKTNKINPEEMKRLQLDNEQLMRKSNELQTQLTQARDEGEKLEKMTRLSSSNCANLQQQLSQSTLDKTKTDSELVKLKLELTDVKSELDSAKQQLNSMLETTTGKDEEADRLKTEITRLVGVLEEHKQTVKQVKNIARKYKKQWEENSVAASGQEELRRQVDELNDGRVAELEAKLAEREGELTQTQQAVVELQQSVEESEKRVEAVQTLQANTDAKLQQSQQQLQTTTDEKSQLQKELDMLKQRLSLIEKTFQKKEPEAESDRLTASIRPMTVKEQKLIVVTPQNVVQPMVQQQQIVAPVSQAQVSTSTPEYAGFSGAIARVVSVQPHVQEVVTEEPPPADVEEEEVVEEEPVVVRDEVSSTEVSGVTQVSQQDEATSSTSMSQGQGQGSGGSKRGRECSSSVENLEDVEEEEGRKKRRVEGQDVLESDEEGEEDGEEEEDGGDEVEEEEEREAESADHDDHSNHSMEEDESEEEETRPVNPISSSSGTHHIDEGVVPSTPTLFIPRRSDGFSEMTSSNRFTFNEVIEEDSGNTGRSVPSTPAPSNLDGGQEDQEENRTSGSGEVPTSSTPQGQREEVQRARPTPIVWDVSNQPTSSSSTPAPQLLPQPRSTFFPLRHSLLHRPRTQVSSTYNRQLINTPVRPQLQRGMQSARRSRPGYFGGSGGGGGGRGSGSSSN